MTSRQVYEGVLIELNKVQAPSLLLEDFNYLFNKAIYQFVNKTYNVNEVDQPRVDNIRVLTGSARLYPIEDNTTYKEEEDNDNTGLYKGISEFILPSDYFHILNCVCFFKVHKNFKCYNTNKLARFSAKRLTADAWSLIMDNFYMKPDYKRPYYYIHNVNTSNLDKWGKANNDNSQVSNPREYSEDDSVQNDFHTDNSQQYKVSTNGDDNVNIKGASNFPRVISLNNIDSKGDLIESKGSAVQRNIAERYGNPYPVRMEVRYGTDTSLFTLNHIRIDYIKVPQTVILTQEQIDRTEDTSQMMEFPDYVCQEIINELVNIVMENASDPRLQTHPVISQSIANPAQQQQQTK